MNAPEILMPDRTQFIGGSDIGALLNVSPWMTPFMLYQKKTGAYVEEITPAKQRIFDRGHRWEPIVLEMLVDELCERGHDVEVLAVNQRYTDPQYPFMACEIDAELMIDGECTNGEMKTANHFAAGGWGDYDSDMIPIYYAAQGMYGLGIKPARRVVFAAVTGFDERPMVRFLERDEETIAAIRLRVLAFWQRIQDGNPPDPTQPEDVKWFYKKDDGSTLDADNFLLQACQELKDMKAEAKGLEGRIELSATRIKAAMGAASALLGPDGKPVATWKNNKASVKTDWKAIADALKAPAELVAKHATTTAGARPFVLK